MFRRSNGHRFRHGEHATKSASHCCVRDADSGVPTRWLDDDHSGTKRSVAERIVDHRRADTVLHGVEWIEAFVLHDNAGGQTCSDAIELDERSVAHRFRYVLVDPLLRHNSSILVSGSYSESRAGETEPNCPGLSTP